jgi:nucleotide-binding universal stress UspA family protein
MVLSMVGSFAQLGTFFTPQYRVLAAGNPGLAECLLAPRVQSLSGRGSIMYARILVPVDGSATSMQGLTEAIELAKALRAQVKVIHVVNELLADYTLAPSVCYEKVIEAEREAGKKTLAGARDYARNLDFEVELELIETIGARASTIIVEAAKLWQADLIVMGTHGRRGLQRLALGSDAELVLRAAPVPVLMVRDMA